MKVMRLSARILAAIRGKERAKLVHLTHQICMFTGPSLNAMVSVRLVFASKLKTSSRPRFLACHESLGERVARDWPSLVHACVWHATFFQAEEFLPKAKLYSILANIPGMSFSHVRNHKVKNYSFQICPDHQAARLHSAPGHRQVLPGSIEAHRGATPFDLPRTPFFAVFFSGRRLIQPSAH